MPQHPSFDLATREWIEVRWVDPQSGQPPKVGLRDLLLHAHEIEAVTVTPPPVLSAMYRLLYALTARVSGLDEIPKGENEDDWEDRRAELVQERLDPDSVSAYFDQYRGRFDLFDSQHPFLQDPRLADPAVCPKPAGVNKLALGRPAGNNSVWFGHHWDGSPVPVPAPEAFGALLAWLYYGPSGRCATRTHENTTASDVSAGPLRASLSYHPEGDTLLHTLLAGLTSPPPGLSRHDDPCPWEVPELPDPLAPPAEPDPYPGSCSRLTGGWQHALLLVPDATGDEVTDAYITWGRREKQPQIPDAYVIYQLSQQGNLYARPADSRRALWRDLDGLLQLDTTATGTHPRRPPVLERLDELGEFRARALGFEQDGKTKDIQFVSASTPPLLFRINEYAPRTAKRIGDLRAAGVRYGNRLEYAAKLAWANVIDIPLNKVGRCAWVDHVAAAYWPAAEEIFWTRLREENYQDPWRPFLSAATAAFEQVTQQRIHDVRTARAIEHARLELHGGRRKPKRSLDQPPVTSDQ